MFIVVPYVHCCTICSLLYHMFIVVPYVHCIVVPYVHCIVVPYVHCCTICSLYTQLHGSLELFGLLLIGLELGMRLKWLGTRAYLHHPRTMIKVSGTYLKL